MPTFAEEIIALVKQKALTIQDNDVHEIKFGHDSGKIFISKNPDTIADSENEEINGEKFYYNIFKKD